MTIGQNRDHIRVLLYSYYTTITGWGVLLSYSILGLYSGYIGIGDGNYYSGFRVLGSGFFAEGGLHPLRYRADIFKGSLHVQSSGQHGLAEDPPFRLDFRLPYELQSKLLVFPLTTPMILPYIAPYVAPYLEPLVALFGGLSGDFPSLNEVTRKRKPDYSRNTHPHNMVA